MDLLSLIPTYLFFTLFFHTFIHHQRFLWPSSVSSYRRGKSSDARLVALLPQQEVLNDLKVQLYPEGLHLLHLPFVDDIRCPEKEASVVGTQVDGKEGH